MNDFINIIRNGRARLAISAALGLVWGLNLAAAAPIDDSLRLYWERAVQRAGREETVWLYVQNTTDTLPAMKATLTVPDGLTLLDPAVKPLPAWKQETVQVGLYQGGHRRVKERHPSARVAWRVRADQPVRGTLSLQLAGPDGAIATSTTLPVAFGAPVANQQLDYVPPPQLVDKPADAPLVGMINCPLWKPGAHHGWDILEKSYPWRKPALSWYDESDPEVIDWEIKYLLEHGVDFTVYCWYRKIGTDGQPLQIDLKHGIHEGLFNARYADRIKFAIMWTNGPYSGIKDEADLFTNLFPFWMENYFKRPNYLVIDNKPVLYVYDIDRLVKDLGSPAAVKAAVEKMRAACVAEGFAGLWLMGEARHAQWNKGIEKWRDSGFDATFAYCWGVTPVGADDATAQNYIMERHQERLDWNLLPSVPTASAMWNPAPWEDYIDYPYGGSKFMMSPAGFKELCRQIKTFMQTKMPEGSIGRRMVLLDNWNEWSEGHYLAPNREIGFAYLDAIREVFTTADPDHLDLLPEEVGRGPYEKAYEKWIEGE